MRTVVWGASLLGMIASAGPASADPGEADAGEAGLPSWHDGSASGGTGGTLVVAGVGALAVGWILGAAPILATICDDEDSTHECQKKRARRDDLDGALWWNLIPVVGPWVVVASSDDTFSRVWSGIMGTAQVTGALLLAVGLELDDDRSSQAPTLRHGAPTLLTDGEIQVPGFVLGGSF